MEPTTVRLVTGAALAKAPNIAELCVEYTQESANTDLIGRLPSFDSYFQLEQVGVAHFFGAYKGDDHLVGFAVLLVTPVLHFAGRLIGTTESIFVAAEHRPGGAGMALLRAMEAQARDLGATGIYVSGPAEGRLVKVLPSVGYKETNRTFYRGLQS